MNTSELRSGFKDYMTKRFPNDNHISATVSMAFFLERNSEQLDIDFQEVLSSRIIPATYKQKLEVSFAGSKNPRGRAAIYERSLRLLLEYLDGKPPIASTVPKAENKPRTASHPAQSHRVPRPTKEAVMEYLERWKRLSGYTEQEDALYLLFRETYPTNTKLSEVLIKCSALNDFYGTNIFNIYPIAKHIVGLNIDARLANGDPKLVNDIARGHGITSKSGKELLLFSFATKYCSHHNPLDFPIFDSYVEKLLIHFRNADRFSTFSNEELRDYLVFKRVILDFQRFYQFNDFDLKQIDQYLWQFGKDVFPKQYGKNEQAVAPAMPKSGKEVAPVDDVIRKFNSDMENTYHEASRLGYTPTYFWQMVQSMGGYQAAKKLIYAKNPASGLTRLWKLHRLDLSVEAHVVKPEYSLLFTEEERRICTERLESFMRKP